MNAILIGSFIILVTGIFDDIKPVPAKWKLLAQTVGASIIPLYGGILLKDISAFGLYLNFPVFYTDVSHIWRLNRRQRCVVNFAGVYFQIIILLPILLCEILFPNNILRYIILGLNLNFLITLNPFFKFDGYWFMTDLLGISNLRKKSNQLIKYYWYVFIGRKQSVEIPFTFLLKKHEKVFL